MASRTICDLSVRVDEGLKTRRKRNPSIGVLCITHYQRILEYMEINRIHELVGGSLVKSRGPELAQEITNDGFDLLKESTAL